MVPGYGGISEGHVGEQGRLDEPTHSLEDLDLAFERLPGEGNEIDEECLGLSCVGVPVDVTE
jgi:hypothetical protein